MQNDDARFVELYKTEVDATQAIDVQFGELDRWAGDDATRRTLAGMVKADIQAAISAKNDVLAKAGEAGSADQGGGTSQAAGDALAKVTLRGVLGAGRGLFASGRKIARSTREALVDKPARIGAAAGGAVGSRIGVAIGQHALPHNASAFARGMQRIRSGTAGRNVGSFIGGAAGGAVIPGAVAGSLIGNKKRRRTNGREQ